MATKHASKVEQVWQFADSQGTGGILKVNSRENINPIMEEFPTIALSEIELYPLVEYELHTTEEIGDPRGGV